MALMRHVFTNNSIAVTDNLARPIVGRKIVGWHKGVQFSEKDINKNVLNDIVFRRVVGSKSIFSQALHVSTQDGSELAMSLSRVFGNQTLSIYLSLAHGGEYTCICFLDVCCCRKAISQAITKTDMPRRIQGLSKI